MNVWMPKLELERLYIEAERTIPCETGGILAGYTSEDENDVVVTNIIGPGPEAKHFRFSYRPDYETDKERIGELFDESGGKITYLGDWHTHPSSSSHLSWMDKRALRNMARFEGNFMDAPIMLIASNGSGQWDNLCWRVYRDACYLGFLGWGYLEQHIILY